MSSPFCHKRSGQLRQASTLSFIPPTISTPMGVVLARLFPPTFQPERDMPDLSGQVRLVTGGNTGIGYETVRQLLLKNVKVYLGARSPEKGAAAIKRLEDETKNGVMISPPEQLTAQNYDLQFGTNVIGHFFLTELLLPAFTESYKVANVPARVINVSSMVHSTAYGKGIEFVSLKGGPKRDAWVKEKGNIMVRFPLYGQSKMGNIFISNYFAKQHSDVLVSCTVHPGSIKSDLQRHVPRWLEVYVRFWGYPTALGAYPQLWAATIATPAQITGQYVIPWGKIGTPDKRTTNMKLQEELVAYLKEQVKGF
ncbi:Short-chain dehydrogenase/reductase family protein [Mycena venus]|uniref:Short-chain dehydrogenase/reductase family protein n=1 Tax=Mycena venus TaxID=2733690 RepID=A0A8H6U414_9AGAR|nr:Short-chain dehydrogenase/reductase family protein [Mycena venus]